MNKFLPVLIFFIFADVISDNSILRVFGNQSFNYALILSTSFLIFQIVAAPIQSGFSDFYCRKKSLLISLSASLISLCLLYIAQLFQPASFILFTTVLLLKGALGNTVPLVWSALADTQEKNLRFSLGLSTGAYAIGYMVLAILSKGSNKEIIKGWLSQDTDPIILFAILVFVCWLFFRDIRDKEIHFANQNIKCGYLRLGRSQITSLIKDMQNRTTLWGLMAYFLWATSQYSILIPLTDFDTTYTTTVIVMMVGYLIGVLILGFSKKINDQTMIRIGFVITIVSLSFFTLASFFVTDISSIFTLSCFFYTLANAFLSPSILSLFSKERDIHKQGNGFGLIVSSDNTGFLIASIFAIFYNYLEIPLNYAMFFSFITFAISWFPYLIYEKSRKDHIRVASDQ